MNRNYPQLADNLIRYLTASGSYPYEIQVRTPCGLIRPTLYSYHDLLTVNEVFCRQDYFAATDVKVIVDFGSNIGISALYFLTRNNVSKCYLFEPDSRNTKKLTKNLHNFPERYILAAKAVYYASGTVKFGIESTGRYGGIGLETGNQVEVDCLNVNSVLKDVIDREGEIDLLKIDTEGVEIATFEAIETDYLNKIHKIYLEARPKSLLHPDIYWQRQYGSVCQLTNKRV